MREVPPRIRRAEQIRNKRAYLFDFAETTASDIRVAAAENRWSDVDRLRIRLATTQNRLAVLDWVLGGADVGLD